MPLAQLGRAWSNLEAAARANRLQPGLPSQHSASAFLAEDFLTQRTGRPDLYLSLRPVSSSAATITLAQTCVFLAAARALGAVSRSRRLRPGYFSLHPPLGHVTDLPRRPRFSRPRTPRRSGQLRLVSCLFLLRLLHCSWPSDVPW